LEMGADDYVPKPVQPRVLLARIRVLVPLVLLVPLGIPLKPLLVSTVLLVLIKIVMASLNVLTVLLVLIKLQ